MMGAVMGTSVRSHVFTPCSLCSYGYIRRTNSLDELASAVAETGSKHDGVNRPWRNQRLTLYAGLDIPQSFS